MYISFDQAILFSRNSFYRNVCPAMQIIHIRVYWILLINMSVNRSLKEKLFKRILCYTLVV